MVIACLLWRNCQAVFQSGQWPSARFLQTPLQWQRDVKLLPSVDGSLASPHGLHLSAQWVDEILAFPGGRLSFLDTSPAGCWVPQFNLVKVNVHDVQNVHECPWLLLVGVGWSYRFFCVFWPGQSRYYSVFCLLSCCDTPFFVFWLERAGFGAFLWSVTICISGFLAHSVSNSEYLSKMKTREPTTMSSLRYCGLSLHLTSWSSFYLSEFSYICLYINFRVLGCTQNISNQHIHYILLDVEVFCGWDFNVNSIECKRQFCELTSLC